MRRKGAKHTVLQRNGTETWMLLLSAVLLVTVLPLDTAVAVASSLRLRGRSGSHARNPVLDSQKPLIGGQGRDYVSVSDTTYVDGAYWKQREEVKNYDDAGVKTNKDILEKTEDTPNVDNDCDYLTTTTSDKCKPKPPPKPKTVAPPPKPAPPKIAEVRCLPLYFCISLISLSYSPQSAPHLHISRYTATTTATQKSRTTATVEGRQGTQRNSQQRGRKSGCPSGQANWWQSDLYD